MNKYYFFFLFMIFSKITKAQNNDLSFAYGGSFAGFGDLQGKFMSVGYHHKVNRAFYIYGSLSQASMSGQAGSTFHSEKNMLGADNIHIPLLDITSLDKDNELSDKYYVGGKMRLDPPYSMMNTKSLDVGVQLYLLRGSKLGLYIEGNLSLVKLEWTGVLLQQLVTIENNAWLNNVSTGKPDIVLNTPSHEHFLDWGVGYGIGVNYYLNSFLTVGANGHYNYYLHDAQNIVTWNIRLGIKIGK